MINLSEARLKKIVVHKVGNKSLEEGIVLSENLMPIEDEGLLRLLIKYFLSAFSGNEMYHFYNDVSLDMNEVYVIAKRIFENTDSLLVHSEGLAKHLHSCSMHPKIKGGELYVAWFRGLTIDDKSVDAIGIFKSETKEDYLKLNDDMQVLSLDYAEGINTNKLDKGCIIFNTDEELGYQVCIIDNLNKQTEAQYWKNDFLNIKPVKNEFHQTNQLLGIAKQFVTKQLTEDFQVSKTDQIDLLNRSVDYFKTHDTFDKEEFETNVFHHEDIIGSFRKFDENYRKDYEIEVEDKFDISHEAVKKQAKNFKSILKLDKNFHIYIHGSQDLIEQGIDEKGRKFYKLFYQEEN